MKRDFERYDLSRDQLIHLIDQWIFNEKHREILKDRFLDGLTYEKLAEKHSLSCQQAKNIVYKSMDRLEKRL